MRFLRRHGLDLLIIVVALDCALEVALRRNALDAPRSSHWFAIPAAAIMTLPLLGRRLWPFAAPAAVWVLAGAFSFADGRVVTFAAGSTVAGLIASFLLGQTPDVRQARIGLAIVLGGAAIVAYNDPKHSGGDLVFIPALFAIAWLAGYALRERAAQAEAAEERAERAEREREVAARLAVAEERARIARELHDVVAHAMSVIVLHVGAVRHGLPPERTEERDALEGVERTGRTALAEMRRLLGALRRDDEDADLAPQPGLSELERLVEQVRRTGLLVHLHVDGDPSPLPRTLDLSAYRVVQEGLTNALKHAHAKRADVHVRYAPDAVEIDVRDDGDGPAAAAKGNGLGHGLVGIRERVKIYGGSMSAGAADGGGFVLHARFPLEGAAQ